VLNRSRRAARFGALLLAGTAWLAVSGTAAAQQVPYDPTRTQALLTTVDADASGVASANVELPAEVTPGYDIVASGISAQPGPEGQDVPRSVIATVLSDDEQSFAAWSSGEQAGPVIVRQTLLDRSVRVVADGFKPGTPVRFTVRYTPTEVLGEQLTPSAGGSPLPRTGQDIADEVTIGVASLVLGACALSWAWTRRRRAA